MPAQISRAKRFLKLAQHEEDTGLQAIGHRMMGACLVTEGDFINGRRHLERGVALYDRRIAPQRH
jgi:hypothetical protein